MHRDYVGLASIFLRLAMAPDAVVESSDIGCQDEARGNATKIITGRIVRSDNVLLIGPRRCQAAKWTADNSVGKHCLKVLAASQAFN